MSKQLRVRELIALLQEVENQEARVEIEVPKSLDDRDYAITGVFTYTPMYVSLEYK